MSCFSQIELPPGDIEFREVYDERWDVPGTKIRNVASKALTFDLVMTYSEGGEDVETVVETATVHAFSVNGEWRWILPPNVVRDVRRGLC